MSVLAMSNRRFRASSLSLAMSACSVAAAIVVRETLMLQWGKSFIEISHDRTFATLPFCNFIMFITMLSIPDYIGSYELAFYARVICG